MTPYKNDFPLLADELKSVFGIVKIGRHSCIYKKKKYIMNRYFEKINDEILNLKKEKKSIKKCFVFRYIMGFYNNNLKCLCLTKYGVCNFVSSFEEDHVKFDKKIDIPNVLVNNWFGGHEKFLKFKHKMFKNYDLIILRIEIENIISKINSQHLTLSLNIIKKIEEI